MVSQYQAHRSASLSRYGKPIRPATVNRELSVMRRMYNVAMKGLIVLSGGAPAANPVSPVRAKSEHNERDIVLSQEEFQRVMDASPAWLRLMILMAHDSGMRRSETAYLRWDQVDLKARMMKLTSLDTKTEEKRLVPLSDRLLQLLCDTPRHVSGYLFVTRRGKPYHPTALSFGFKKACQRAHLRGVVFHDLRHTFCTNMRRAGVDTMTTMAISGHKSIAVFRGYNTISPQGLRTAIQRLGTHMDTSASKSNASE